MVPTAAVGEGAALEKNLQSTSEEVHFGGNASKAPFCKVHEYVHWSTSLWCVNESLLYINRSVLCIFLCINRFLLYIDRSLVYINSSLLYMNRSLLFINRSLLYINRSLLCHDRALFWDTRVQTILESQCYPLGQKMLEMVPEPRGDCFKLWAIKSRSCCHHSPRLHIGDALWNSEPDSRHQFSQCFWSAFLVFRKMRFRTESAKTYHPKHCPEGWSFWPYGRCSLKQIFDTRLFGM